MALKKPLSSSFSPSGLHVYTPRDTFRMTPSPRDGVDQAFCSCCSRSQFTMTSHLMAAVLSAWRCEDGLLLAGMVEARENRLKIPGSEDLWGSLAEDAGTRRVGSFR